MPEHKLKFVIVAKEHDRRTRDVYKQEEITPVLYFSTDHLVAFVQGGVWLFGEGRDDGGAAFSPHADRATTYREREEAAKVASELVLSAGFQPGDLEVEELKEPKKDGDS